MAEIFVVSSPSGGGKHTLISRALKQFPEICIPVSHTDRAIRPKDIEGVSYHFVSRDLFREMIAREEFAESANVFGYFYGVSKAELDKAMREGKHILLELDVQGAMTVKKLHPDAHLIFIMPPSIGELRKRLFARGTDSAEMIEKRIGQAPAEMRIGEQMFDYEVLNDDISRATEEFVQIIRRCIARPQRFMAHA